MTLAQDKCLREDIPRGAGRIVFVFDGLKRDARARLQVYLALPITIYLGRADTGRRNLARSAAAMRQGPNRLERGRFVFRRGQEIAHESGWAFNWRLVEVAGVGHSSRAMLRAAVSSEAFGLGYVGPTDRKQRGAGSRSKSNDGLMVG